MRKAHFTFLGNVEEPLVEKHIPHSSEKASKFNVVTPQLETLHTPIPLIPETPQKKGMGKLPYMYTYIYMHTYIHTTYAERERERERERFKL